MSLIRAALGGREERLSGQEVVDALSRRRIISSHAGQPVTVDRAMRLAAVWACINLIANTISTYPVDLFRRVRDRTVPLDKPPILTRPNPTIPMTGWLRQILVSLLARGNAWGIVLERDGRLGFPTQAEIVDPDTITVRREGKLGRLRVRWDGSELAPDEYLHVAGYLFPGSPIGLSPIAYAAQIIGLGLAAEEFGARWFGDGAHPSGILSNEEPMADPDGSKARTIKQRWMASIHGTREPAVLTGGWKWQQVQISPNESQFLDTIQANGAMIATIFGLRPEDVGFKTGDSNTYANVEMRQIDRLVYPIAQWVVILEEFLTSLVPRGQFVKLNVDANIRPDTKTRTEVQTMRLAAGITSVNEERKLIDLDPIGPEGDRFNWPPKTTRPAPQE